MKHTPQHRMCMYCRFAIAWTVLLGLPLDIIFLYCVVHSNETYPLVDDGTSYSFQLNMYISQR